MPIGGLELSLFLTMTEVEKAPCGPLAQWLAQSAHNRLVLGSNPRWPTRYTSVAQTVRVPL